MAAGLVACGSGGAAATTTAGSSVSGGSQGSSGGPPTCEVEDPLCPCGAVGCACFSDGSCTEGVCGGETRTCVVEEDGMVFVPGGPFWMGCREGFDTDELTGPCPEDQLPYREVTVDAFWIDKTEVTKGAYRECMEAGVCGEPYQWDEEWTDDLNTPEYEDDVCKAGAEDMPVASASWLEGKTYCEWAGKRLPTEAEWEKAARGTDSRKYPWGNEEPTCEHANHRPWDVQAMGWGPPCPFDLEGYDSLTRVGSFPKGASPHGALDMAGNVDEWCEDGYVLFEGYGELPTVNPVNSHDHEPWILGIMSQSCWSTWN
jgi:formylglycine-generating enzyme required for sulfatase activity